MVDHSLSFKDTGRKSKARSEKQSKLSDRDTDFRRIEHDKERGIQTPDLATIQESKKRDRSPHNFIVEEDVEDDEESKGD